MPDILFSAKILENTIPALLASVLTLLVGYIAYTVKIRKDRSKSCIIIAISLENFVDEFIDTYFNNRTYISTLGNEGHLSIRLPEFKTAKIQANWHALPNSLIKDIFSVESRINAAKRMIKREDDPNCFPGDYEDFYISHVTPIASTALKLSKKLRHYGKISELEDFEGLEKSLQYIEQDYLKITRRRSGNSEIPQDILV